MKNLMSMKKRILVDMDAIVVDFFGPLMKIYETETGEKVVLDQILSWDMAQYVGQGDILLSIFKRPFYFRDLAPLPGAINALKRLSKKYDVVIASYACTPDAAKEKVQWCEEWLPFLDVKSVFLCSRKELIKADCLIDDGLHNAAAYKIAWPKALVLTIAYPYNNDNGKIYDARVGHHSAPAKAWKKILQIIEKEL
jgi:5'(3')-deoxyribonucleotidase